MDRKTGRTLPPPGFYTTRHIQKSRHALRTPWRVGSTGNCGREKMPSKYREAYILLRDAELNLSDAQYNLHLDKEECLLCIRQAIKDAQNAEKLIVASDE